MRMPGILDKYSHVPLAELFADQTPVSISDPSMDWIHRPSPEFLNFVTTREPLPFEGIPADDKQFKKDLSFPVTQVHRLSATLDMVRKHLPWTAQSVMLDLGAYPFSVAVSLRDLYQFPGRLHVTSNLELSHEVRLPLQQRRIDHSYLELDTYVVSGSEFDAKLSPTIAFPDQSVDLVVFSHVIEHLYHPIRILKEAFRVLKPGGKLLLTTDNALMLETFLRLGYCNDFVHEPVHETAAMTFNFWRGHNRFFSPGDLHQMCSAVGLAPIELAFYEILYNSFAEEFFHQPVKTLPAWKARILGEMPVYRNELMLVAQKSA